MISGHTLSERINILFNKKKRTFFLKRNFLTGTSFRLQEKKKNFIHVRSEELAEFIHPNRYHFHHYQNLPLRLIRFSSLVSPDGHGSLMTMMIFWTFYQIFRHHFSWMSLLVGHGLALLALCFRGSPFFVELRHVDVSSVWSGFERTKWLSL